MRLFVFTALLLSAAPGCLFAQQLASRDADLPTEPGALFSTSVESSFQASSSQDQQQPSTAPAQAGQQPPQDQQATPQDTHAQADRELKQQETQRMLGIVPAFNEVIGGKAVPLTPKQKFSLFFHSAFDPYQFGIVAIDAGIEQAQGEFPEYHYGIEGYARRYAAAFTDNFDGNFWGNAVLPSILHQDPRYYRLGHGNPMRRILYSASTAVICKGDNGHWEPNYSNVSGNLIGGAISNFYYPASDRGIGLTFERGLTVTATGAVGALAEEFYPDFAAYLSRRHARKLAAQAAAQPAAAAPPQPVQP